LGRAVQLTEQVTCPPLVTVPVTLPVWLDATDWELESCKKTTCNLVYDVTWLVLVIVSTVMTDS